MMLTSLDQPEAKSVSDSIAASIDKLSESEDGGNTPQPVHVDTAKETPATGTQANTGQGAAAKTDDSANALGVAKVETQTDKTAKDAVQTSLTDTPARQAQRGPASWKPEVREKWANLPPEVQAEVTRRETEIQSALQAAASHRQFVEQFGRVTQPYQHIIALEGNDPIKSFEGYMRTAAILRTGTAHEKANAVADAIATFGIDIALLDSTLQHKITGGRQGAQPSTQQPQQFKDPRLDTLLSRMDQEQAAQAEAQQQAIDAEIAAFKSDPANEFYDDLRVDIADILNLAARRGQQMTLKQAYDRASGLNPDISKVLSQREAAKQAAEKEKLIAAKRNAGSSITTSAPRQTGSAIVDGASVRAAIEKSIESLSA